MMGNIARAARRRRGQRGVTLVELASVTAVVLALASITIPVANTMVKRQKEIELRRSLRQIREALDRFQFDTTGGTAKMKIGLGTTYYPKTGATAPGFGDAEHPRPLIYFWTRDHRATEEDPDRPGYSISFNQKIMNLDIDLGTGNPGAIGIDHRAAEGSTVEDITVYAEGAFAGIRNAPGSGRSHDSL